MRLAYINDSLSFLEKNLNNYKYVDLSYVSTIAFTSFMEGCQEEENMYL